MEADKGRIDADVEASVMSERGLTLAQHVLILAPLAAVVALVAAAIVLSGHS